TKQHSAYRLKFVTMEYPWHPLHGQQLQVVRRKGRGATEVIHVEVRNGLSRELPGWMFDKARCETMSLGSPEVALNALMELRDVLACETTLSSDGGSSSSLIRKREGNSDETIVDDPKEATGSITGTGRADASPPGANTRRTDTGSSRPASGSARHLRGERGSGAGGRR
ncbi:hypothetical protein, partial [Paraburkholderia graminis]